VAYLKSQTSSIAPSFRKVKATTFKGNVTVGVDDAGHDVKFFGATASRHMEWDESADQLNIHGKVAQRFGSAFKNQTHAGWVMGGG